MNTKVSRFLAATLVALVVVASGGQADAQVTLTANQPAFEVSQLLSITLQGPPDANVWLLVDILPGPFVVPNLGTFCVAFSPYYFVVPLGPLPASGEVNLSESFSCRTAYVYGQEVYLQAVSVVGTTKQISNCLHIAEMPGDCSDDCLGGVQEVGLQVALEGVPMTGNLYINAVKTAGDPFMYGPLDIPLDLATAATGVLETPILNASGSVAVSMLELDGTTLTVRFFINAPAAGPSNLAGITVFRTCFGGVEKWVEIDTSCAQPLFVGQAYGDFSVIKVLDLN